MHGGLLIQDTQERMIRMRELVKSERTDGEKNSAGHRSDQVSSCGWSPASAHVSPLGAAGFRLPHPGAHLTAVPVEAFHLADHRFLPRMPPPRSGDGKTDYRSNSDKPTIGLSIEFDGG